MAIIKTQGLVLKYTDINEADRILTILTRSKGKIKAISKGCRRPKSSLLPSSELFAFSELILYKGTNFYHVSTGELRESFYNIRNDLLKLSYAVYFAELADTVTDEDIQSERLFLLLSRTLYYLSNDEIPIGILSCAYQMQLMDLSGFRPLISKCANCGNEESLWKFSIDLGGALCSRCFTADKNAVKLSPGALETFGLLLSTPISRLNTIKIDNTIFIEIDKIINVFVQKHLDKRFKSMDFINNIKSLERE
ncbi:DNA repair protein RecO [Lutispora sp.]|uniref:DNA repair protein RecO n=1 Tax=Lutispora sp. TaxID=2828727 RepID=UPI002B206C9A|nr:DNA repair protein RecO [Lutispora sp.]MEA4960331.1 DNA repair protein RecO [Lutispora sp.]